MNKQNTNQISTVEDALAACITSIEAGKASVQACLEGFPQFRDELAPLLEKYASIREHSGLTPSKEYRKRGRAELISKINGMQDVTFKDNHRNLLWKPKRKLNWRFNMLQIIIITLLALGAATGGAVYASDGAEPGQMLYGLDRATEQIRLNLARDEESAAYLRLEMAMERIEEARGRLEEEDLENAEEALNAYGSEISELAQLVGEPGGADYEALAELVTAARSIHIDVLTGLLDQVPEQAQEAIQHAIEVSSKSLENMPGPPEDAGPSEGSNAPDDAGPSDEAGPPDDAGQHEGFGSPDGAGPPETPPRLANQACKQNLSEEDAQELAGLAEQYGINYQALVRMFCSTGSIEDILPMQPEAAGNRPNGGPPTGVPGEGGRH